MVNPSFITRRAGSQPFALAVNVFVSKTAQWSTSGFSLVFVGLLAVSIAGCKDKDDNHPGSTRNVIYLESNEADQNNILAYQRNDDGSLTPLPGSPFNAGGKGIANPQQLLGPSDLDKPLLLSADRKRLFAVNSGSNTIAVFSVGNDGALAPVAGSPFPSGGINPVSVGMAGNRLYVVNKNQDPSQLNEGRPNYTVFNVEGNGKLTPVPGSTIETIAGASPSFAYVSRNQQLLFGTDFLAFKATPAVGTLRAFAINADGTLTPAPGTPMAISGMGGALGLYQHPKADVLYVGFPMEAKVGVYTFDPATGALTFKTTTPAGKAACWIRVNDAGTVMYTLNSAESTISIHDVANAEAPGERQKFTLKTPGPLFTSEALATMTTSSEPFFEEISPDGKYLYVVSQHVNPDFSSNYNYFHVLKIDETGNLSEPGEPLPLPVSSTARPQGIATY